MFHDPPPISTWLLVAAAALTPALATARTVILANAPGTLPNGETNSNLPATFGDNVAATVAGIFETTAGTDGTIGTPGIGLTWSTVASPSGATNANAWQFHSWDGATVANTGGGALQMDGSRTGSIFAVTFTPAIDATVKLNSFNFVGDTNADVYQYRVRVVRMADEQVVFTTDTVTWTTATGQNPSNTDPDTWAAAPKVEVDFTGTAGAAYRLEIERLDDDSTQAGSRVDIAIDYLDFDQLTTVPKDLVWTGSLSSEWSTNPLASPKNWALSSGGEADFAATDRVSFDDTASGTETVDISTADVTPGGLLFENQTAAYTLTGTHGIAGNVALIKNGAGSLTLSNPNLHRGRTAVNGGSLVINHPTALQNSTLEGVSGSATHGFGAIAAATLGGLAGNAGLLLESSSNTALDLTVGSNHANTVHSGEISGSGSLTKQGTGTLILTSPTSTFTGPVVVSEGTLRVDGLIPASASAVTVASGATFGGSGIVQRPVTLTGGSLAPGSGVGTLQNVAALGVATASTLRFDLADWTGTAGSGYDTVTAGSMVITATPQAPASVVIAPQTLANFTDTAAIFTLVSTTGGIGGFEDGAITVDASALPAATSLTWSVQLQGTNLVLVYGVPVGTPFEQWATAKGLAGLQAEFEADPDLDGISNGIEFVIGGEPNPADPGSNSPALLPTMTTDSGTGDQVFVFRRTDAAAGLNPLVEYDTDLTGPWTPAQGGVDGVTINETVNGFATGIDRVEIRIPSSEAVAGRLFARLAVTE